MAITALASSIGALVRFLLLNYTSMLLINSLGCFLLAITNNLKDKEKNLIQQGFLGGFTSLSVLFTLRMEQPFSLLLNIIVCFFAYWLGGKIVN